MTAVASPGAPLRFDAPTLADVFAIPPTPPAPRPRPRLTVPQAEALALAAQGLTYRQIARRLYLSEVAVRRRMVRVFRVLGVHSKAAGIRAGVESGILDPDGGPR